jgi:hypothetical protein
MLFIKTILVTSTIAVALLATPPETAAPKRIHEQPRCFVPRAQPGDRQLGLQEAMRQFMAHERTCQKHGTTLTRLER